MPDAPTPSKSPPPGSRKSNSSSPRGAEAGAGLEAAAGGLRGLRLGLRWRLGDSAATELDPQLFALLGAIAELGSLRAAAEHLGVSYRHAWGMVRDWGERLGAPLATLERGRGTSLLPLGEKLLQAERSLASQLGPRLERHAAELAALLAPGGPPGAHRLRVVASVSPALSALRDVLQRDAEPWQVELAFRDGLESLRALAEGRCDLAGFHCPEGRLGERLAAQLRRPLRPETHVLIHLARRRQGLLVAQGNPMRLAGLRDLAERRPRFVNRQVASGTRMMLDELLLAEQVEPRRIRGYDHEEFTPTAVAALVASGAADAAFGIEAVAGQFGLGFVPLLRERYLLALARSALSEPVVERLRTVLRGQRFRTAARQLPGYDTSRAGDLVELDALGG